MENYILNLLKENKRIIIPDFGAFIIRSLNYPEIAFNSLLTFNDGILTEYVSKVAGISYMEAAAKVSDYAEKLKADIQQHHRLTFNEIGWVWTDDSGEMQFTAWKDTGETKAKSQVGLKDLDSILKEAELSVKSDELKIENLTEDIKAHESSEDIQSVETINQEANPEPSVKSPDQIPFTLDETLKEVDVDATKDLLTQKSSDSVRDPGKIQDESFTLEESDKSAIAEQISPEKSVNPQGDKSDSRNELHIVETVPEPVIPKTDQKDEREIQFDEKIMASLSAIKAKSEGMDAGKLKNKPHELSPNDDWRRSEIKSTHSSQLRKEKKRRSWILPVSVIGLAIILAGVAWFIFPEQVKNIIYPDRQLSDKNLAEDQPGETAGITSSENEMGEQLSEEVQEQESVSGQEQVPEQNVAPGYDEKSVTAEPETPVISDNNPGADRKYYIVAGSFKYKANAEKYVTILKQKGFNAELFGTHDNLYAVSFSSFSSRTQAEEELKRIRHTTEPNAWILLH
jgi:cell division septation protein DedD/nucleoid DNA-binding protein